MRVGTLFTGVTACAGLFAPTANAQTAGTLAPMALLNTVSDPNCNNNHWFHARWSSYPNGYWVPRSTCYGDRGFIHPHKTYSAFCGGTNFGYFSGHLYGGGGGRLQHQKFGPGQTYYLFAGAARYDYAPFSISTLHISGFTGHSSCYSPN
jgi:hypothetical protein